jgi:hypothetical protein
MNPFRTIFYALSLAVPVTVMIATAPEPMRAQTLTPPWQADPVTLKVTRQQLNVIGQGLQELPAKLANPVLNDLQAQLEAADKAAREAAEPKPTEKPAEKP